LIKQRPRFMEQKRMTASEIGTAMHTVMQQLHIHGDISEGGIAKQVDTMIEQELLTLEQAENITIPAIAMFFHTWIGQKVLAANNVEREVPFTLKLSAKDLYPDWKSEQDEAILVQGIVDCLIEEEDGILLIDYKTDNISKKFQGDFDQAIPVLRQRYETQIQLYAEALEKTWKKVVKGKYLYFFDGGHVLEIQ